MDYDPADGSGPAPQDNPPPHQHMWLPGLRDHDGNSTYGPCSCGAPYPG